MEFLLYTGAGVVTLGLGVHGWRKTFYHFAVAHPGRLYRAGTLPPAGLWAVCRFFRVDTVINLRSEEENAQAWYRRQRTQCERLGVEMIDIPMRHDTPPTPEQLDRFLEIASDARRRCLVHCEMGVIRTGMMVLAYLAHSGRLAEADPWRAMPAFGHDIRRRERIAFQAFVESYRQQLPD